MTSALAQTADGGLYGWGYNDDYLSPGGAASLLTPLELNIAGSDLEGKTIDSISYANESGAVVSVLILTTDGEALAWGQGGSGFLGQDTLASSLAAPTAIPSLVGTTITDLQGSNGNHALALTDTGDVYTWGNGNKGSLGQGDTVSTGTPIRLSLPAPVTQIESGFQAGFALLNDGTVSAWGNPEDGTLGSGTSTTPQTPTIIATAGTALEGREVTAIRSTRTATIFFTTPAAAITPINILTPADGATVEPGFTIAGTGETGATVTITDAAKAVIDSFEITNADGSWSYTTNTALAAGTYSWTLTQDADGSVDTLTFTINAAPVITPVTITGPAAGSTVGLRPTLTGAGTPDAIITITDGAATLGTATVGTTGTWTFTPTADLALGAHTLTATQDVDSSTATVAVTVATTVPTPDPTPSPTPGTGSGTGELSSTGADAAPLLLIGGLLAAAGITAAVLGRRKRTQAA